MSDDAMKPEEIYERRYSVAQLRQIADTLEAAEFHEGRRRAAERLNEIDAQIKALKQERRELCSHGWFAER